MTDQRTDPEAVETAPARRQSGTLGRIAVEVFSIVLGVLLALAVSQWQEQRQIRERVTAALQNVVTSWRTIRRCSMQT